MDTPQAFLSYAHVDDEFHGGAITRLRQKLEEAVRVVSGRPFTVFQDRDGKHGIAWGLDWQSRLDEALSQARFLIPIITPSWFESEGCRDECLKFLELERRAGRRDLVLAILFADTWQLEDEERAASDDLVKLIKDRQRRDWRAHADVDPHDASLRPILRGLATEIHTALRRRIVTSSPVVPSASRASFPDLQVFSDHLKDGSLGPELVVIPAGRFLMGSPKDEEGRDDDEGPRHRVSLSRFALGRYAVTFEEYDRYCAATGAKKPDDSKWGRGRRPVIDVTWDDAKAYCAWLSGETGKEYRLPSEAEWEYACRAGTVTRYSWGDQEPDAKLANFGKKVGKTTEVGSYPANPWKLHDMHGNVWEWCEDTGQRSYEGAPEDGRAWGENGDRARVIRGGSWGGLARLVRSAYRGGYVRGDRNGVLGFRCARGLE